MRSSFGLYIDEPSINEAKWLRKHRRQSTRRSEKSYAGRRKLIRGLGKLRQPNGLPYTPIEPRATASIIDTPMMASGLISAHPAGAEFLLDLTILDGPREDGKRCNAKG